MKRLLATVAALILPAAPAVARAQGTFGIKGGLSYGNVSNQGLLPGNLQHRTGFAAGISVGSAKSLLGFGGEALYAQRGANSSIAGDAWQLDYLDVPVYLRVNLPSPGVAPFAYAGPQASFELRCRAGTVDCPTTTRPKTSYAGVIGGGARLGGPFSVEGRYVYGLTDLKLSTIISATSYHSRSFAILAGVSF